MKSQKRHGRFAALLCAALAWCGTGLAATYTVDRTDDADVSTCSSAANDCTLRGAIKAANAHSGADTINFSALFSNAQTITLATSLPDINGDLDIAGPAAGQLTVNHGNVFRVSSGFTASFSNLTISGGTAGIRNLGTATVTNCVLSSNTYGILNLGSLTVINCTATANAAGIYNQNPGTMDVSKCNLSNNTSNGIVSTSSNAGPSTVANCTIFGNRADGILCEQGTVSVTNCTLTYNNDGLRVSYKGKMSLRNSICAGNLYGDIQNLTGDPNAFIDGGYNLVSGTAAAAGFEVDAGGVAILADNGGPTKTNKLLPGSPAIDKGGPSGLTTDQRGFNRPIDNPAVPNAAGGDGSDIGAYEATSGGQLVELSVSNAATKPEGDASAPGSTTFTIALSAAATQSVTVNYQTVDGTAEAGSDYISQSGTLTFNPGQTAKFVRVIFIGDTVAEANETLFLDLKTPINANMVDSRGSTYIRNDDGPSITIDNALTVDEGNSSTTTQVFTVHLSAASTQKVTVDWSTANGTAGPADYVVASGTLTFNPGVTSKLIVVQVKGDTTVEPTETYRVNLSNPTFAVIGDSQGVGYVRNDDVAALNLDEEPSN